MKMIKKIKSNVMVWVGFYTEGWSVMVHWSGGESATSYFKIDKGHSRLRFDLFGYLKISN